MIGKKRAASIPDVNSESAYGKKSTERPDFRHEQGTVSIPTVKTQSSSDEDAQRVKRLASVSAVSLAVALIAVVYGTWSGLSGHASAQAISADTQTTLVASSDIAAGEIMEEQCFALKEVPRELRVKGAFDTGTSGGSASPVGKRALVNIPAGTQMTASLVAGFIEGGYLAGSLNAGKQAVSIAVDAETGIGGGLRANDRVRVVALDNASLGQTELDTIAEDVRVLALGVTGQANTSDYSCVTLELTPDQANAVRSAQFAGKVSLILVSALDSQRQSMPNGPADQTNPTNVARSEKNLGGTLDG